MKEFGDSYAKENWLVEGDFNATICPEKKKGGSMLGSLGSVGFRKICKELSLVDLAPRNGWFT